jgi:murein DD-endopeptidase MepM/ murein hydrolase activator NlpD
MKSRKLFQTDRGNAARPRRRFPLFLLAIVGLGLAVLLFRNAWLPGPPPTAELLLTPTAIGRNTELIVRVTEPKRGISRIRVVLSQGDREWVLWEEALQLEGNLLSLSTGPKVLDRKVLVGAALAPGLQEGSAFLRATAWGAPSWLRSSREAVVTLEAPVLLKPPALEVLSQQHHAAAGGAEAVVYRVGPTSIRDGVAVGDWFFPGAPLDPSNSETRFALFGIPWELTDAQEVRLVAQDAAGNLSSKAFLDTLRVETVPLESVHLKPFFLERINREILEREADSQPTGDPLQDFLWINRELRKRNNEQLRELGRESKAEFLWNEPFLALPGGKVMSRFASRRVYYFEGREVDRQTHLGFDLASVAQAPVPAAGSGVVVFADWLGIYGWTVVLDHGHGLMSLYAHLSELFVKKGQQIERGALLGRTGSSGLAGGDHLHFSFLLRGLPVQPIEWWDARWISHRIGNKLGSALPRKSS